MGETIHETYPSNGAPVDEVEDAAACDWFAVARSVFDHHVVGIHGRPYTDFEAWLSLISMAQYTPRKAMNKGTVIMVDPGQLMAAHAYLAKRWTWTSDKVRWFLKKLESEAMIARDSASRDTKRNTNQIQIITICKYVVYQHLKEELRQATRQPERQASTKPAPSAHQANTKNLTREQENKKERDKGSSDPAPVSGSPAKVEAEEATPSPPPKPAAGPTGAEIVAAFEAYNALAARIGLPIAKTLTPSRREGIKCRLRDHGDGGLEVWHQALANVEKSGFLRGKNDRNFRADLEFLIRASKFSKVLDGAYGNGAHADFYHDTKPPAASPAPALPLVPVDLDEAWAKERATLLPTEEEDGL